MKLFLQKNAKFSSAGGSAPRPPCLRRLGALPPNPQPPAAGGFAPRPPLASGGWGLCPQTPQTAPPHCEFLATRLFKWTSCHNFLEFHCKILNSNAIYRSTKMVKNLNFCLYAKKSYGTLSEGAIFFLAYPVYYNLGYGMQHNFVC